MVQRLVPLALIVSLAVCGISELQARRKYAETQHTIEMRKAELQKMADVDQQLQDLEKKKSELQHRMDLVNRISRTAHEGAH